VIFALLFVAEHVCYSMYKTVYNKSLQYYIFKLNIINTYYTIDVTYF